MKPALLSLTAALLTACTSSSGHFNGQKGPQRRGSGNADLEGPNAHDVIRDVHRDRARQDYEDRGDRTKYGAY